MSESSTKPNMTANLTVGDSKAIVTNQDGVHEKLEQIVSKHLNHKFEKPFQAHTLEAFKQLDNIVKAFNGPIILDACCGVGQSTRLLAKANPDALVIGVDKSAHRINRNVEEHFPEDISGVDNFHIVRADLNDFYRLVAQAKWPVDKHYILYPNPWPKAKHIQRRWHGSAVFPQILSIGKQIILRSNWQTYLDEFLLASQLAGREGKLSVLKIAQGQTPLTPFEAKFIASNQRCWQLDIQ